MATRSGFTLIELLVVVTILVVLLALLAPAIDKAMGFAMEARCLSNLHQIGVALRMYTGDHRGYFPPKLKPGTTTGGVFINGFAVPETLTVSSFWWVGTAGTNEKWATAGADVRYLNRYLGHANSAPTTPVPIAFCPGDTEEGQYVKAGTSYSSNHHNGMSSLMARGTGESYAAIKISRVLNGSRLVAGADGPGVAAGWNNAYKPSWHRPETHALLFVDAHATMETMAWGLRSGASYTFDETGRE